MIELVRTNDPVLISWLASQLEAAGVRHVVLDTHTSFAEGSIGAIQRRVMVLEDGLAQARAILAEVDEAEGEAGERHHPVPGDGTVPSTG